MLRIDLLPFYATIHSKVSDVMNVKAKCKFHINSTKALTRLLALFVTAILVGILIIWVMRGNKALELNTYTITSCNIPKSFDGFRIAQVSDVHNTEIEKNNEKLIYTLKDAKPDIIVITGDMIDSRRTRVDVALKLAQKIVDIAPCYYVSGNHESRVVEYNELKAGLIELGINVLEDSKVEIELLGERIMLIGVDDPSFNNDSPMRDDITVISEKLDELVCEGEGYTILLSHRPELFEAYVENNVDLVFSGHAHGGQFRFPFVGGLVAPHQGLFPEYDSGIYTKGDTNMVVSRGIGNSIIPFRVNNKPEVILVELDVQK